MPEFTQEHVNSIVRAERRQWEEKIAARRAELEVERGKTVALQQEHDDLAARLAEFETESAAGLATLQAESDAAVRLCRKKRRR